MHDGGASALGRHVVHVMGTVVSFDLHTPVPTEVLDAAVESLHHADYIFSMYRADSDMARLSRGDIRIEACHPDVEEVLALCADATRRTGGYFSAIIDRHVDPTGLVKGWAVQRTSDLLRDGGSQCHVVNGGGDVQLLGAPDGDPIWRVGIANPFSPGRLIAVALCPQGALATSGTAERGLHIVDPHTGDAASYFASATILAPSLVEADILATAAFARGGSAIDWVEAMPDVEGLFVESDGRVITTTGFHCELAATG